MVQVHCLVAGTKAICEETGVGSLRVQLSTTAAADHRIVGVQVLLVVLGEKLASTTFDHFENSLLILEAFFAQFMHYRLNFVLDQLENTRFDLC